ncbi:MAG: hypothetical protein MHMPM18_001732 [Marteilia pararefringens]
MARTINESFGSRFWSFIVSLGVNDLQFKETHSRYQSTIRIMMLIRLIPIWLVIIAMQMHIPSADSELFRRVLTDQYEGCKLAWINHKENASKDILSYDSQELIDHCEYTSKDGKIGLIYISMITFYVVYLSALNYNFSRKVPVRICEIKCLLEIILLQILLTFLTPYSLAKSMAIYSYFGGTKEYEFVWPSAIIIALNVFDMLYGC